MIAASLTIIAGIFFFQLDISTNLHSIFPSETRLDFFGKAKQRNLVRPKPIVSDLKSDLYTELYRKEKIEPTISFTRDSNESAYGHLPYGQANQDTLVAIASYGTEQYQRFEFLAPQAARALMDLIYSARHDGVWIVPASAFRSFERQEKLFQDQIERKGSIEEAAKVSAPPGYSEHHTGLAVDLVDGHFPKKDISLEFANTDAFKWLTSRAIEFGFEMSFPPGNPQNISYEPWHWRYIGTPEASATFGIAE